MAFPAGAIVGGHRIIRPLGSGGAGMVYLAHHPRLPREVALKVLHDFHAEQPKTRKAFAREAQLMSQLSHVNIVDIYDCSRAEAEHVWLSMRYVGGGDLASVIAKQPGGLDPDRAIRLVADVADALDHAHDRQIMHQDVKPANILLDGNRAILTDFGIAHALDATITASRIAASWAYTAPERFGREPLTGRADMYSLAATLFELLTGEQPYPVRDTAAAIAAHLNAERPRISARRPDLPGHLDHVFITALARDPADRYSNCAEFAAEALRAITQTAAVPTPTPAPPPSPAEHATSIPNTAEPAPENDGSLREGPTQRDELHLRRLSIDGDTDAMNELGELLRSRGRSAQALFQRAADLGDATAMNNLGIEMREQGDMLAAQKWFQRGADKGHAGARSNLAALRADNGASEAPADEDEGLSFDSEVEATVITADPHGIAVRCDVGIEGYIPSWEIDATRHGDYQRFIPGTAVTGRLLTLDDDRQTARLSLRRHAGEQKWPKMVAKQQNRALVQGRVLYHSNNGVHLAIDEHLRGFIPWAHSQLHNTDATPAVGTTVSARLRKLDHRRHAVVLTRRHIFDAEPVRHRSYGNQEADYAAEARRAGTILLARAGENAAPTGLGSGTGAFVSFDELCDWLPILTEPELRSLTKLLDRIGTTRAPAGKVDLEEMLVRLERARRKLAQLPVVLKTADGRATG